VIGVAAAIPQCIELSQSIEAALVDAITPLPIDIVLAVAGKRRDHGHAMAGKKCGEVLMPWFIEDGEIAAVDHRDSGVAGTGHQSPEAGVKLGGPSGEIEALQSLAMQDAWDQIDQLLRHHFRARGARIHVAMGTALIAAVAEVHLKRGER